MPNHLNTVPTVCDIQKDATLVFVNDTAEVTAINNIYGTEYNSFFLEISNGDYKRVYGMYGIVPYFSNILYQVR
jgi:hypothetical protein